jgi:hypothetical protein
MSNRFVAQAPVIVPKGATQAEIEELRFPVMPPSAITAGGRIMKQRKLSTARSRADLIASFTADVNYAAPPPPPPADEEKEPEPKKTEGPDLQADTDVTKAIDAAIAAQKKDPDTTDPNDEKVLGLLEEAKAAQAADTEDTAKKSGEPDEPAKPAKEDEQLAVATPAPSTEVEADENLNAPPVVEGGENLGPAFSGVLVIEGQPTGDGRQIAPDALTWRDPPMPLMMLKTETHDPEGFDMNDPAVIAGVILTVTREAGESGTQLVKFGGNFLANEDGMYAADLTEAMGRIGVSADIAVDASVRAITEIDESGLPLAETVTLTEGTIMGGTSCPFPAFQGCYLVLGDGANPVEAKAIPQAAEAPEVPSEPPALVSAGGQLIHLMAYEECSACDEGIEVIVASGAGPSRPPTEWFEDPKFEVGDGRLVEILGRNGKREGKFACPITITADGRLFGHLAPWGVCHAGKPGCVTAPPSAVGYAHFMHGYIMTAEGEKVRVGALTADAPHAALGLSATAAMDHYDNTATTLADVAAGGDGFGIWLAGAVRPDATEDQIRTATSRPPSGDWREIGGQLELVAALCVPVPGFPLAIVAHGKQEALVAYGAQVMDKLKRPEEHTDLLQLATPALTRLVRRDARERIAALA